MSWSSAPVTAMSRSRPGKIAEIALTAWRDGQAVLEQPVPVGLVVMLGRRHLPVASPRSASPRRARAPAGGAGGGSGSSRAARAGPPPSAPRRGLARRGARRGRTRPSSAARSSWIPSWPPNRGWTEKRPTTWTTSPAAQTSRARSRLVPDDRRNRPGAVPEHDLHELPAAVAAPPHLDVAHEQRLGDLASVAEFPDFHDATKIEWPADGSRGVSTPAADALWLQAHLFQVEPAGSGAPS